MDKIEKMLKELILELAPSFNEENINYNTNLVDDLLFNSLTIIQLIVDIEDKFNIELDDNDLVIEKLNIFSELLKLIKDKL